MAVFAGVVTPEDPHSIALRPEPEARQLKSMDAKAIYFYHSYHG